jgi:hypothetical protein
VGRREFDELLLRILLAQGLRCAAPQPLTGGTRATGAERNPRRQARHRQSRSFASPLDETRRVEGAKGGAYARPVSANPFVELIHGCFMPSTGQSEHRA